jgi:acyl-CoA synthetase (AMP-forming)/AMP-acid ligase II
LFQFKSNRYDGDRRSGTVNEGIWRKISKPSTSSGLRSNRNLSPSHTYSLEGCSSAGKAAPRVELKIIDQDGKEVEVGQIGEIIARGPQIMKGYFKDPQATAKKIKDGWYHSGDLGRFDEDGYLYVLGRADDMVITGGLNVYPSEVETVLLNHPKVQEAAAVGIPDAKRGQVIRAIVVLKHGETATPREILSFCKKRLASFKMPRQLEFKDSLPKSSTGKIIKRQL